MINPFKYYRKLIILNSLQNTCSNVLGKHVYLFDWNNINVSGKPLDIITSGDVSTIYLESVYRNKSLDEVKKTIVLESFRDGKI